MVNVQRESEAQTANTSEMRVVRIAVPIELIRSIDQLVLRGIGGFATRAEFFLDAAQERLTELTYDTAPELTDIEQPVASADTSAPVADEWSGVPQPKRALPPVPKRAVPHLVVTDEAPRLGAVSPDVTVLGPPATGVTFNEGTDVPTSEPMFGLHNRDYPSLWVASRLAEETVNGAVKAAPFYDSVTAAAWEFGRTLVAIEEHTGLKCTALFPTNTNPEKRKAAEAGFRAFAIGTFNVEDSRIVTAGPLFQWRLATIRYEGDDPFLALTDVGRRLLSDLAGLSVVEPHPLALAQRFLRHVEEHAPADWWGFATLLARIGTEGATRGEVVAHFRAAQPEWKENEASTNAAGYVARAREWGLVVRKQEDGRYVLTGFGIEMLTTTMQGSGK